MRPGGRLRVPQYQAERVRVVTYPSPNQLARDGAGMAVLPETEAGRHDAVLSHLSYQNSHNR